MNHCDICEHCGCPQKQCGCAKPVLEVSRESNTSPALKFNVNGVQTTYDYADLVHDLQTDTSLAIDIAKRVLRFIAERHQDSLTAAELGSILHLGDLGDVSAKGAETGSLLFYKKDDTCGEGCVGTSNQWEVWSALNRTTDRLVYAMGFDSTGSPFALRRPTNPNQFYQLGWNAENQLSYTQPAIATAKKPGDYTLYMDKDTKEIYGVAE